MKPFMGSLKIIYFQFIFIPKLVYNAIKWSLFYNHEIFDFQKSLH